MRKLIFIVSIFCTVLAIAQNQKPQLRFITDSVMLGELVEVELTYHHPKEFEVLFPDSTFDYKPFEFVKKKLFTTRSNDSISSDCTIYLLQTFELDHVQDLQLGVTMFTSKDSFIVSTNSDSVFLKEISLSLIPYQSYLKEN